MGYTPPHLDVRRVAPDTTVYGGALTGENLILRANSVDPAPTIQLNAGDGFVYFGTYSAAAGETFQGYITIKDAAGNARKLAVYA